VPTSRTTGYDAARVDPGRRGVDRQLADGDLNAADALVADAEDALGVGDDDEVDLVGSEAVLSSDSRSSGWSIERNTPRGGGIRGEALDRLTDRRGVDDRQHLLEVVGEQPR
jgi:hypothetical protein